MKSITVGELATWLADGGRARPLLLDVREPWEQQICQIPGSEIMPMQQVPARFGTIDADRPVVCICHHGRRSLQVANFLLRQGFEDVYNLTGGVDAWAREVDPTMATY